MAAAGGSTFKDLELAGWDAKAGAYDDYAGTITTQVVAPLLDAAAVGEGTRLLDVACGPGYLAGAAAERGAEAIGVDFAPAMVSEAARRFSRATFQHGDAEALPFESHSFDAVVCGFALGHLPEPDRALLESFRVLRPGGRYAFSWWCTMDKHEFFALVMGSVKAHGTMEVALPPAPPMFRFSDPAECRRALAQAGFSSVDVREHALYFEPRSAQQALDLISRSSVRMAMVLELQASDALSRIHEAILAGMDTYRTGQGFRVGWPALIVSASKAPQGA
jgi:SAM-dependent methyltransferase